MNDERKTGETLKVSISVVMLVVGIILSLVGTVYAITVNNFNQVQESQGQKIAELQAEYNAVGPSLETIRINVAVLCVALRANCK